MKNYWLTPSGEYISCENHSDYAEKIQNGLVWITPNGAIIPDGYIVNMDGKSASMQLEGKGWKKIIIED